MQIELDHLFVSKSRGNAGGHMMGQSPKLLSGRFGSGRVLRVSLMTICIFVVPQARAACALVEASLTMVPEVQVIVQSKTHQGDLARCFLRYTHALKNPDEIDSVVTPEARFHDLEEIGYPKGPEGLKAFRRWLNAQLPDENGLITAMRFVGDDIVEVDIEASGTDPKTGQPASLTVHTRDRFVGDRVAERWDRAEWHTIMPKNSGAKE
jgi:hypothetical protein